MIYNNSFKNKRGKNEETKEERKKNNLIISFSLSKKKEGNRTGGNRHLNYLRVDMWSTSSFSLVLAENTIPIFIV